MNQNMSHNKKIFLFSLIFSILLLSLTGLFLWHKGFWFTNFSARPIRPKLMAKINGEPIWRSEVEERLAGLKEFLESQYGEEIFKGEKGQLLLAKLENKVLNEVLEEKLIAQEAKKLGIRVSEAEVQKEIERIARKVSGSFAEFEPELESNKNFLSWLREAKKKAKIEIYASKNSFHSFSSSRCCPLAGGAGGCGGPGARREKIDPQLEEKAKETALQAYKKNNPEAQNLTAKVLDFGCHLQVDIEKEGEVVKSYVFQNGEVKDL